MLPKEFLVWLFFENSNSRKIYKIPDSTCRNRCCCCCCSVNFKWKTTWNLYKTRLKKTHELLWTFILIRFHFYCPNLITMMMMMIIHFRRDLCPRFSSYFSFVFVLYRSLKHGIMERKKTCPTKKTNEILFIFFVCLCFIFPYFFSFFFALSSLTGS